MWNTSTEIKDYCKQNRCKLSTAVLNREMDIYELSEKQVFNKLKSNYDVMKASSHKTLETPITTMGDLITGDAKKLYDYSSSGKTLCGHEMVLSMAKALSSSEVNASMGRICAAPTAGACGIIPAAFSCAVNRFSLSEDDILSGLLAASGIGALIESEATISGAVGGCQAECGAAAAMAAAGLCEMLGGDASTCL